MAETYIDDVLIKLNRKYGKDELVASLNTKIREKDVYIGQLLSEIDELRDKLGMETYSKNEAKMVNKRAKIELRKDERFIQMKASNDKKTKEIKELKILRDKLISSNNSLVNRVKELEDLCTNG